MKFSICIPNYNYGNYIGETIDSALEQDYQDFEILISDNLSTDNSWEVINNYVAKSQKVFSSQNTTNLGFAGNLDPASKGATGDYMIMLSSDDLINQNALSTYKNLIDITGNEANIISSICDKIDSNGKKIGSLSRLTRIWRDEDFDKDLTEQLGAKIYKVKASDMLNRCLKTYSYVFNFTTACYRKADYLKVGGYGSSRLMNPDKWFHWRLLGEVEYVYLIEESLFSYRWHQTNQTAQLKKSGALKYFVDEYRSSFEITENMLNKANVTTNELQKSFIYNIVHKQAFAKLKKGESKEAFRILRWGIACYPQHAIFNKNTIAFWLLASLGKLGYLLLKPFKKNYDN